MKSYHEELYKTDTILVLENVKKENTSVDCTPPGLMLNQEKSNSAKVTNGLEPKPFLE